MFACHELCGHVLSKGFHWVFNMHKYLIAHCAHKRETGTHESAVVVVVVVIVIVVAAAAAVIVVVEEVVVVVVHVHV